MKFVLCRTFTFDVKHSDNCTLSYSIYYCSNFYDLLIFLKMFILLTIISFLFFVILCYLLVIFRLNEPPSNLSIDAVRFSELIIYATGRLTNLNYFKY